MDIDNNNKLFPSNFAHEKLIFSKKHEKFESKKERVDRLKQKHWAITSKIMTFFAGLGGLKAQVKQAKKHINKEKDQTIKSKKFQELKSGLENLKDNSRYSKNKISKLITKIEPFCLNKMETPNAYVPSQQFSRPTSDSPLDIPVNSEQAVNSTDPILAPQNQNTVEQQRSVQRESTPISIIQEPSVISEEPDFSGLRQSEDLVDHTIIPQRLSAEITPLQQPVAIPVSRPPVEERERIFRQRFEHLLWRRDMQGVEFFDLLTYRIPNVLTLEMKFDKPVDHPIEMLRELAAGIVQNSAHQLKVIYQNQDGTKQEGFDSGGLKRDFMTRLFLQLSKELKLQESVQPWMEELDQVYKDIGVVFHYHLVDVFLGYKGGILGSPTPIGEVMHSDYFKGILNFTYDETRQNLDALSDDRILELLVNLSHAPFEGDQLETAKNFIDWDGSGMDPMETQDYTVLLNQLHQANLLINLQGNLYTDTGDINIENLTYLKNVIRPLIHLSEEKEMLHLGRRFLSWDGTDAATEIGQAHKDFLLQMEKLYLLDFAPGTFDQNGTINQAALANLKGLIAENLIQKDRLRAFHAIAQGMTMPQQDWLATDELVWEGLKEIGSERVQMHIQGKFDRNVFFERLKFKDEGLLPISTTQQAQLDEIRREIFNFLRGKNDDELKRFLHFTTGSPIVPNDEILFRIGGNAKDVVAHSCEKSIEIPLIKAGNLALAQESVAFWDRDRCIGILDTYCIPGNGYFNRR